jgi:hypothetical protein
MKPTGSASVKSSHALKNALIQRTIEVWQPRLGRGLTCENARQIAENMVGFFEILNEWRLEEAVVSQDTIGTRAEPGTDHTPMWGTAREVTTERANS